MAPTDEYDGRRLGPGLGEQVPDARRAHSHKHLHEVRPRNGEERHLGLASSCLGCTPHHSSSSYIHPYAWHLTGTALLTGPYVNRQPPGIHRNIQSIKLSLHTPPKPRTSGRWVVPSEATNALAILPVHSHTCQQGRSSAGCDTAYINSACIGLAEGRLAHPAGSSLCLEGQPGGHPWGSWRPGPCTWWDSSGSSQTP